MSHSDKVREFSKFKFSEINSPYYNFRATSLDNSNTKSVFYNSGEEVATSGKQIVVVVEVGCVQRHELSVHPHRAEQKEAARLLLDEVGEVLARHHRQVILAKVLLANVLFSEANDMLGRLLVINHGWVQIGQFDLSYAIVGFGDAVADFVDSFFHFCQSWLVEASYGTL